MSKKLPFVSSSIGQGFLALCLSLGLGCGYDNSSNGTGSSAGSSGSSVSSKNGGSTGAAGSSSDGSSGGNSGASTSNIASGGSSATGGTTTSTCGKCGTGGGGGGGSSAGGGGAGGTGGNSQTGGTTSAGGSSANGGSSAKPGGSGGSTTGSAAGGSGGSTSTGAAGGAKASDGCGKTPSKLKNNPPGSNGSSGGTSTVNKITVGGKEREFLVRWPTDYKNDKPYRIVFGLHGAGGTWQESGMTNYGLWDLSKNTTIFVSLSAEAKFWDGPKDLVYFDEVLKLVKSELCIDTSRVMLEGFSQGAAMSWYLTGSRPGVLRAVVGHSGGGVGGIPTLSPVAYFGSLGTQEGGNGQNTQTDQFARADSCTIESLPTAPSGKHVCTPYKNCKEGFPVTWCSFDGGHGFEPRDSGASSSWMPQAVWDFISPL